MSSDQMTADERWLLELLAASDARGITIHDE
jgi:hypothetical protein